MVAPTEEAEDEGVDEGETSSPFGDYLRKKIGDREAGVLRAVLPKYEEFSRSRTPAALKKSTLELSSHVDSNLTQIREALGGRVTPFSTFRGYFIEEVAIRAATIALSQYQAPGIVVKKLGTGTGIVTGLLIKYRKGTLPPEISLDLQRDREDVVLGFQRRMKLEGDGGTAAEFRSEIVPICTIACKMYIDATRLENVLAKARSFYGQYAKSAFFVLAEWDALGQKWHDSSGVVMDSLYAPVQEILFLRDGDRPDNSELRTESLRRPYRSSTIDHLFAVIADSLDSWGLPRR
ncbi:MAG TPA: hypothetical protein VML94_05845 [Thermoplasmata archaeon]|nr:hypothetical protein [Thermoplasmata archaeon]